MKYFLVIFHNTVNDAYKLHNIQNFKKLTTTFVYKLQDFSGGFDVKIDCAPKISGKMGHISPNNPLKIRPNPPENMVNPRTYPGSFTELKCMDKLTNSLVGCANFYRVVEPSVCSKDLNKKRRYKLQKKVKKEEELALNSSNTILKYFPKKSSSSLCITGKRKYSCNSTEVLKKPRVGTTTMD